MIGKNPSCKTQITQNSQKSGDPFFGTGDDSTFFNKSDYPDDFEGVQGST